MAKRYFNYEVTVALSELGEDFTDDDLISALKVGGDLLKEDVMPCIMAEYKEYYENNLKIIPFDFNKELAKENLNLLLAALEKATEKSKGRKPLIEAIMEQIN